MKKLFYFVAAAAILAGSLLTTSCKKDKTPETGFETENIVFMDENDEVVTGSETVSADGNTHEYILVNTETKKLFTGSAKWTIAVNGQSVCKDAAAEASGTPYNGDAWYVKTFPNSIEFSAEDPAVFSITAKDAYGKALTLNIESI